MDRGIQSAGGVALLALSALAAGCLPDRSLTFGGRAEDGPGGPADAADADAVNAGPPDAAGDHGASAPVPRVCVEPAVVDFGEVRTGESETQAVRLRSCGNGPLTIRAVILSDDGGGWFLLDGLAPPAPAVLEPPQEAAAVVRCVAGGPGVAAGRLDVFTDDPALADGRGYVRLVCTGRPPPMCALKAAPAQIDFGKLAGGVSVERAFEIVNVGDAACNVTSVSDPGAGPFSVTRVSDALGAAVEAPFSIVPSGRAGVTVGFTAPIQKTCSAAVLSVENDSQNVPRLDVPLRGCGGEDPLCELEVSPHGSVLNFGNVFKGSQKTLDMFFESTGTSPCTVTGASFGSETGPWYSLSDGTAFPIEVPPGSAARVGVRCSPAGTGPAPARIGIPDLLGQNVVAVSTNDPAQPRAAGLCPSDGWCRRLWCVGVTGKLDVLPSPVHFGLVTIGCASAGTPVKLYNNGDAPLTITAVDVVPATSPAVFLVSPPLQVPLAIAPRSSATLMVRYEPSKEAVETATLRIATDAPNAVDGAVSIPMTGEGTSEPAVRDAFRQSDRPMVDVLWCVDNSPSMGPYQLGLAQNMPGFIAYAGTLGVDYQMGVVTAEINQAERGDTGDMIYPGVLFQRSGYPRIVTNSDAPPRTDPYAPSNVDPAEAFAGNAMPGECCAGEQESCLEAIKMALSEPLVSDSKANEGFLRRYAKLAIVVVSDEDDQSPGTVGYHADFLRGLKGLRNQDLLSVSLIAGVSGEGTPDDPPAPAACTEQSRGAARYLELFETVGNGVAFPICAGDWAGGMRKLGLGALYSVIEYFLSRPADPASIVVMVNGSPVKSDPVTGYTYDSSTNSVVFGRGAVPPPGAAIDVIYRAACY